MSQIDVHNLTFGYEGSSENIFEDVSFRLDTDWKLGFTGRNGRGKTTFLNLLMGRYEYRGAIAAGVPFAYFPFTNMDPETITRDALETMAPDAPAWALIRELYLLELTEDALDRPFGTLSNGEQTKVQLAALFAGEDKFLLIDEPTNHLDTQTRHKVAAYLKSKKGFILVSHDRVFLDECVDHILSINRQDIEITQGNFSVWWENKQRQDEFELSENERLKKDIKRLDAATKRTAKWSDAVEKSKIGQHTYDRGAVGHKAAKMMKRSKNIESRQQSAREDKEKLLKNIEKADALKLSPLSHHAPRWVELNEVTIRYGDKVACRNVNLTVGHGDRVALQGSNGCGKSSVLKLVMGEPMDIEGRWRPASGLILSYVPQDTSFLTGGLSQYARDCNIDESLFKAILRKLDFSRAQFDKDMRDFSAGQKKKALIARSLCESAHLYVWDEPLNYIDVLSRMQIEALILEHRPTLLFVEHDAAFVDAVATRKVELASKGVSSQGA